MINKRVAIIYGKYYDFINNKVTIGGIQTYIKDLIDVCRSLDLNITLYQKGNENQTIQLDGYCINQLNIPTNDNNKFAKEILQTMNGICDLAIFATDTIIPKHNPFKRSIAIQHGIFWDIPSTQNRSLIRDIISSAIQSYQICSRIRNVNTVVCVDYNFINWYRTQVRSNWTNLEPVPNYTPISVLNDKPSDIVNIIFARRLWWYRGTQIFTDAIKKVLKEYPNIKVTIAGDGPDGEYMHSCLDRYKNVEFIRYASVESLRIHADKHIAIVPTVGSEGTSLSLLEAMSSQCAVIASNVGGMTNIILDGYNGLMVNAGDSDDLYNAICKLLQNPDLLKSIAKNGYETVRSAFSIEKWKSKWSSIIKSNISHND